jgi:rSAM/selenodomain-associated transferase 2
MQDREAAMSQQLRSLENRLEQPLLSVIIPTLNEADTLPALLADFGCQEDIALEIVIGDGRSTDATEAVAGSFGGRFVRCPRGRGAQMNAAAGQATGIYFLFLHADSRLDDSRLLINALAAFQQAEKEHPRVAGHFRLRFMRSGQRNRLAYRYIEEKTALNRTNTTNGDQGLLLSRTFFHQLGGFDDSLPFLEDQRLAEKIRGQGRWITLPGSLHTSARRFESEGFHRRYLLMGMMMGLFSIGELAFFTRAPGLYRVQQETGQLLLTPFFGLLWSMVRRDWGLSGTLRTFYRLGQYIRHNAWQLFFFVDVWLRPHLGPGRYPLLGFYDRLVAPCIDFRLVSALTGLCCFVWYMGILAPFFWLQESLERTRKNGRQRDETGA